MAVKTTIPIIRSISLDKLSIVKLKAKYLPKNPDLLLNASIGTNRTKPICANVNSMPNQHDIFLIKSKRKRFNISTPNNGIKTNNANIFYYYFPFDFPF
jgi:hypothetical protein